MKEFTTEDGRRIILSGEEVSKIVEGFFNSEIPIAETPTSGCLFEVKPAEIISSNLFDEVREGSVEIIRKFILQGIQKAKSSDNYLETFYVLVPELIWNEKTLGDLKVFPQNYGGDMEDWVQFSLECGQRILNGETFQNIIEYLIGMPVSRVITGEGEYDSLWILGRTMDYQAHLRTYTSIKEIEAHENPPAIAFDVISETMRESTPTKRGVPSIVIKKSE